MALQCRPSWDRRAQRSLARIRRVAVCLAALAGSASGCGAAVPATSQTPPASATTHEIEPTLTLGGDATEGEVAADSSTTPPQAKACDEGWFWDGERCLPRRELLTSENVAQVVPRCEAGDDQLCPLALQQLRHNCELGVDQQCAAARRLLDGWVTRRDHPWAEARCDVGQYAACLLASEHERRRCSDGHMKSCVALAQRVQQQPELQVELELTAAERRALTGVAP